MQGRHAFEPTSRKTIDLESFVADDHYLRKVDRVLELSFVVELTAECYSDGQGRPSIAPEIYFRMLLVSYIYGISSDRRLCEEVRYNLAYRWFCQLSLEDAIPDHSSLSRIRDRFGVEIFEKVFSQIVVLCKQKGLIGEQCRVITDATLIAADASLNSLVNNDPQEAKKEAEAQRQDRGMIGSSVSDCRACEQSATCTAARPKGSDKRFILRNVDQELFEEVTTQMSDPTFKQKMSERMWKIEGLFAEAKDNHGLARAKYRGRTKVQIQAYLTAIVQNLKRLVFLFLLLLRCARIQIQKAKQRTRFNFSNLNLFNTPHRFSDSQFRSTPKSPPLVALKQRGRNRRFFYPWQNERFFASEKQVTFPQIIHVRSWDSQ